MDDPAPPPLASRPPSIVLFERLYGGSILLSLVGAALFWSSTREIMATAAGGAPGMAGMLTPILIGSLLVTTLVSVLFWWLVARGRSVAGKWLIVVTEALGAVSGLVGLFRLVTGNAPNPGQVAFGLVTTALAVAAAAMLFRPDAAAWFVQPGEPDLDTDTVRP